MSVLLTILLILVVQLAVIGGIFYFLWVKFGKKLFKNFENLQKMSDLTKNQPKLPTLSHFEQEMKKINEMLQKYQKK
jgi:hypothetical protein